MNGRKDERDITCQLSHNSQCNHSTSVYYYMYLCTVNNDGTFLSTNV